MKIRFIIPIIAFLSFFGCASSPKIVVTGSGWNNISIIDKETKNIEWTHNINDKSECNSVAVTPKGNIVYSYKQGARMIDLNENVIWDYKLTNPGEIHSITLLEGDKILIAASGEPAQLITLDSSGKCIETIDFNGENKNLHGQMRQVTISRNGNYLIPLLSKNIILELDKKGNELARYKVSGSPFSVLELPSLNLLASCGDSHCFAEIDRKTGEILKVVDNTMLENNDLLHYVAQILQLKNGNLMLCNWNGHFKKGEKKNVPHLIEFDKDYNVVWQFDDFNHVKRVSAGFYVDNGRILKLKK